MITDYDKGIPVGHYNKDTKDVKIYNHLDIRIKTHLVQGTTDEFRVVGFEVHPKSIRKGSQLGRDTLDEQPDQLLYTSDGPQDILFTYTLRHINDDETTWATRMDHFYQMGDSDVLMKELIFNAILIAGFGTAAAIYLKRSINRDFAILQASSTKKLSKREKTLQKQAQLDGV